MPIPSAICPSNLIADFSQKEQFLNIDDVKFLQGFCVKVAGTEIKGHEKVE